MIHRPAPLYPFVEEVAQDDIHVPVIAKCSVAWFPVS